MDIQITTFSTEKFDPLENVAQKAVLSENSAEKFACI